jgi:hypothetical protein
MTELFSVFGHNSRHIAKAGHVDHICPVSFTSRGIMKTIRNMRANNYASFYDLY